jgi:hypothetical protein
MLRSAAHAKPDEHLGPPAGARFTGYVYLPSAFFISFISFFTAISIICARRVVPRYTYCVPIDCNVDRTLPLVAAGRNAGKTQQAGYLNAELLQFNSSFAG